MSARFLSAHHQTQLLHHYQCQHHHHHHTDTDTVIGTATIVPTANMSHQEHEHLDENMIHEISLSDISVDEDEVQREDNKESERESEASENENENEPEYEYEYEDEEDEDEEIKQQVGVSEEQPKEVQLNNKAKRTYCEATIRRCFSRFPHRAADIAAATRFLSIKRKIIPVTIALLLEEQARKTPPQYLKNQQNLGTTYLANETPFLAPEQFNSLLVQVPTDPFVLKTAQDQKTVSKSSSRMKPLEGGEERRVIRKLTKQVRGKKLNLTHLKETRKELRKLRWEKRQKTAQAQREKKERAAQAAPVHVPSVL